MRNINFAKTKQRIKNGLIAALFIGAQVGAVTVPFLNASVAHAAPVCTIDTAGANDEPGQKDLTKLCVDYAGLPNTVATTWNWDETGTSGSNTMDACNLFDTDGDGNINYSVCVTTTGDPATKQSLTTYSCGDAKIDRCTSTATVVSSGTTSCDVSQVTNDPFPTGSSSPKDTQGSCTVQLSTVGGSTAKLIDVCSYPSEQPNSDPSDCVIAQQKAGKLEVVKDLVPNSDTGLFNLQIDSVTKARNVGDNGTTGELVVPEGNHSVGETQGTSTTLSNYTSTISCKDQNGTGSVVASGSGTSLANVPVADGSDIVCTITNTRKSGSITVNKVLSPSNDPGLFNLQINGSTAGTGANVGNGGTTGAVSLNPGSYTIGETAGTNTTLSDYTATWSCTDNDNALASGTGSTSTSLTLASDHAIVCTIANTRNTGSVQVNKLLDADGNGSFETVNPSSFNWSLDGSGTNAMGSTVSNVNTGTHSINENTVTNYHSVGWYSNDGVHNCSNLSGTTFPFNVSVTSGQTATVTICNARDTGSIKVNKLLDSDGNGSFETTNPGAFNWSLDGSGTNAMGSTVSNVTTGTHSVNENSVTNYHLVGWYYTSDTSKSCTNVGSTSLPASLNVTKDSTTEITICNARDTGLVSFLKTVIGGTSVAGDWTFNISDGSTAKSGDSATYMTGSYTVTESGPSGYTLTGASGICSLNMGVITMIVTSSGGQCQLTNTRDTGSVRVNKLLDNDGNGTFETTNPGTFYWSLDGSGTNTMGSTVSGVETGTHSVNENSVANYHLVGWYYTSDATKSCTNVGNTSLPASLNVSKGATTEITICNARDIGTITVNKQVYPSEDDGLFNLQIDGSTVGTGANVGDGGTTGTITLPTGTHSVSEVAGDNTSLDDYISSFECNNEEGGSGTTSGRFTLSTNEDVTCTFSNVRKAKITVIKDAQPKDAQDFNFTIDTYRNLESLLNLSVTNFHKAFVLDDDSDPTLSNTEVTTGLTPGVYVIHEDETSGWTLDNITCGEDVEFQQDGSDILVWVAPGADITCTYTNKKDTGTVTIKKKVTPSTDQGKFNLNINGKTYAANVGDGGTTGAVELVTGNFTASETAGTNTTLTDYEASYSCADEKGALQSGTGSTLSLKLSKDQNIVCTFTNNKGEVLGAEIGPEVLVNTGSSILVTTIASLTLLSTVAGLTLATRRRYTDTTK